MPGDFLYRYTPIASGSQPYLERPRINRLLEKAAQKPIVSIVAGAGYGKTLAVFSFLKTVNDRGAWIHLSERDNHGRQFWENFCSAAASVRPDTAERLRKIGLPISARQFEEYLELLKKDNLPNEKFIFVYDDLHLVSDKAVLDFLERCVTSPFLNICSILISRNELPFSLKKEASKKLLARISGEDLAFSREEMVSCFRLRRITPAPGIASAIYRDTEGWAFAIHLASLSLRDDSSGAAYVPQAIRSNTRKLFESEIMAQLSPELRRFLAKISLVENLNPALIGEIAKGSSPVHDPVRELEKISSFIRFDFSLDSWHIHTLFLEYLRDIQHELSGEEKKEVWTKAAVWCAANNRKMDAINYHEKSGEYNGIVEVLTALPMILPIPVASFVLDILERPGETVFRNFPMLRVMRTRALISLGRYGQCGEELRKIIPKIKALPESSEKHRVLIACNMHMGFIGFILSADTKCHDYIYYFRTAADEARKSGYTARAPLNGISIGFHVCRVKDPSPEELERFIVAVGEMVPYSAAALGGCQYGMYELVRGEYAFYRANLIEAEKYLREAYSMAGEKQQYEIENRALFYLLRIYLSRGNADKAETVLKAIEAGLEEKLFLYRYFHFDMITGWYYLQTGRQEMIAPWLKSDYAESELNAKSHGMEKLIKAKYYLVEKRYPAALACLEYTASMDIFIMGGIEMKAAEAVCRYRLRDREGAYRALAEAYSLASPAGLFMPFTELGKDMRSLAEAALKEKASGLSPAWLEKTRRSAALYAKRLYRQTGSGKIVRGEGLVLSRRETEVLAGLSRGLTREEIAGASSISPNTVKSVTRNIYSKLGALNQADAVRIATERGILPE